MLDGPPCRIRIQFLIIYELWTYDLWMSKNIGFALSFHPSTKSLKSFSIQNHHNHFVYKRKTLDNSGNHPFHWSKISFYYFSSFFFIRIQDGHQGIRVFKCKNNQPGNLAQGTTLLTNNASIQTGKNGPYRKRTKPDSLKTNEPSAECLQSLKERI